MRCCLQGIVTSILVAAILPVGASAEGRSVASLVPADCLVLYAAKPYTVLAPPTTQTASSQPGNLMSVASVISFLNASGLLPDEGQVFADIVATMPLLGRFEHALILLDISSKLVETENESHVGDDFSLRLNNLQTAVIFRTNGQNSAILEQLKLVINRYTNKEVAKLTRETVAGFSYQRLVDSRLIGWAVWEWGRLDDFFVISFGRGAFERIADTYAGKAKSLSQDDWFKAATTRTKCDQATAQWFIAFTRLKERLGAVTEGRVSKVTAALDAEGMTHDLWTIGREGRALSWYRCYRRGGQDVVRRYSEPARYAAQHRRIIPDAAEHIAVIQMPTRWLVDNLPKAWLDAQSESNADKWRKVWQRLEQETGLDINGNLMSHVGQNVVLFDYPPHPLNIPFAITVAIEIDDRKAVGTAVGARLEAWGRYLDERAERNQTTLVRMKVKRADDGIWYLQAGILGPALKVTDQYVVLSWSPEALRNALRFIEGPEMNASGP